MNKIAIVTACFGNRDGFHEPFKKHENADYYCFTDNSPSDSAWTIKKGYDFSTDKKYKNRRNAKIYKILPELFLPNYEYYIWTDITHDVLIDPQKICDEFLGDSDIALFKHRERNCVYNEAEVIKKMNIDYPDIINNQIEFYKEEKFPSNFGLFELPAFIKRANMTEASLCWWELICKYGSRDQISLPYVLWKKNIKYNIIPGLINGWDVPELKSKYIQQTKGKG